MDEISKERREGVTIDPWTKPSELTNALVNRSIGPVPERTFLPGERIYSYQPPRSGQGLWGDDDKYRRRANKLSAKEDWKQWGDIVEDFGDVAKDYSTRPLRMGSKTPSKAYAISHQYPTYSQFGVPQMADALGRQYRWADGYDAEELRRMGRIKRVGKRPLDDGATPRGQVTEEDSYLYIRFPLGARSSGLLEFPTPETDVTLMDLKRKMLYRGRVEWVEGDDKKRASATGSVFLRGLSPIGRASPEVAREILVTLPKKYQRKFGIKHH